MRIRGLHQLVVLDPGVGREIDHVIAEIVIETVVKRPVRDREAPVEIPMLYRILRSPRFADGVPIPSEVPLADAGGSVTLFMQHPRQRELSLAENGGVEGICDAVEVPPMVPSGQQRIAGWGADAGRGMRV